MVTPATTPSFAPYVDLTMEPHPDLLALARAAGVRSVTLAFISADGHSCAPAWSAHTPIATASIDAQVSLLRDAGGTVAASFGAQWSSDLALVCHTSASLASAYESVIDRYRLTAVDFDVNGPALNNAAAQARRLSAIGSVESSARLAHRELRVTLSLPATPSGFTAPGVALLRTARRAGLRIDDVNAVAMNFGDDAAPNPSGRMGYYAIQAARAAHDQLAAVWPSATSAQRWAGLGLTPMLGVNDDRDEVFALDDAQQLVSFARGVGLGRLAEWSLDRDRPCAPATVTAITSCSGVTAPVDAYTHVLETA
jgi:hypothetical protein